MFLTVDNLLNVLRNVSMQGLIALGMTMVIIAGEIDLSVGSMVAFAGCLTALPHGGALRDRDWVARSRSAVVIDRCGGCIPRLVRRADAHAVPGADVHHHPGAHDGH